MSSGRRSARDSTLSASAACGLRSRVLGPPQPDASASFFDLPFQRCLADVARSDLDRLEPSLRIRLPPLPRPQLPVGGGDDLPIRTACAAVAFHQVSHGATRATWSRLCSRTRPRRSAQLLGDCANTLSSTCIDGLEHRPPMVETAHGVSRGGKAAIGAPRSIRRGSRCDRATAVLGPGARAIACITRIRHGLQSARGPQRAPCR